MVMFDHRSQRTLRQARDKERRSHPSGREAQGTQRLRLLEAFVREVGHQGYAETHVDHVCRAAGVSTRDFYRHFPSKEDCFCAALDRCVAAIFDRVAAAYRDAEDPLERRLRSAVRTALRILADHPPLARLCVVEAFYSVPAARLQLDAMVCRCQDELGKRLLHVPPGIDRTDYQRSVLSSVIGPMADCIREGGARRLPELEPLLMYRLMPMSED